MSRKSRFEHWKKKMNAAAKTEDSLKKLNFRDDTKLPVSITPEMIPTLTPVEKINLFAEGDPEPYYKIQEIEYPIMANGYLYTEDFFKSFISKMNQRPIPGSKHGHEMSWGATPSTDILLVGGKVESNGDGTGKVYFKNYIPKKLDTDNESLIKQAKADMIHFSLVSYTRDVVETQPDGNIVVNVIESLYGERNDVVEYNAGAMEQKTNKEKTDSPEPAKNKGAIMNELLEKLSTYKANGELKNSDIAAKLGLELRTDEDKVNAADIAKYRESVGSVEEAADLAKSIKQNAQEGMKAKLVELFGAEKVNGNDNRAHQYAMKICSKMIDSADRSAFDAEIESLKNDPIAVDLKANLARPFSQENLVGQVEGESASEIKITKI